MQAREFYIYLEILNKAIYWPPVSVLLGARSLWLIFVICWRGLLVAPWMQDRGLGELERNHIA